MLAELRIRDIAIIEDLALELGPGLNVLSGETGAGKSIILGALGLVLGARASSDVVRTGSPQAEVQARFDRTAAVDKVLGGLDLTLDGDEDGLLVRRVVTAAGRSRAYIGATAVPVGALRRLASVLVDYSSQHEHQVLLDEGCHVDILERFGGLETLRAEADEAMATLRGLLGERDRLTTLEHEQRAREEYLRFQVQELDQSDLVPDELPGLEEERSLLRHAEERSESARVAGSALYSGSGAATEKLSEAVARMRRLVEIDPALGELLEGVESALISAEEAGRDLERYARDARSDPGRLGQVDDRIALLRRLARKHRCDVGELVALRDRLLAELAELGSLEARLSGLETHIAQARGSALTRMRRLSEERRKAGDRLRVAVEAELGGLAMGRARFVVHFEPATDGPGLGEDGAGPRCGSTGLERVAFQLSANPGEAVRPLVRVASGGELSRILLAIRTALADRSTVQTCVFDEVDSGLGGATVETVGRKLAGIAAEVQVICITHQAQIAARADRHLRVDKGVTGGRTRTSVAALSADQAIGELVRMMAGTEGTDAAEQFAAELVDRARAERRAGRVD